MNKQNMKKPKDRSCIQNVPIPPSRRGLARIHVILILLCLVLLGFALLPSYRQYRYHGEWVACAESLRTVNGACRIKKPSNRKKTKATTPCLWVNRSTMKRNALSIGPDNHRTSWKKQSAPDGTCPNPREYERHPCTRTQALRRLRSRKVPFPCGYVRRTRAAENRHPS